MSTTIARKLRRSMTAPELSSWTELRKRPDGFKFRRQHPFSSFVFDFFCVSAGLAIEVDGMAHDMGSNPQRDMERDKIVATAGIETLRYSADEVQSRLEAVIAHIVSRCGARTPPPPSAVPLPSQSWGGK